MRIGSEEKFCQAMDEQDAYFAGRRAAMGEMLVKAGRGTKFVYHDDDSGENRQTTLDDLLNELSRMKAALRRIYEYPIHSEPVGGAMAMQDIAKDALKPANDQTLPTPATTSNE
jgi:hypothetical protein